jgi:hypothetical protein
MDAYALALAAAMVGVRSVERSGLTSGVNNTFRQGWAVMPARQRWR